MALKTTVLLLAAASTSAFAPVTKSKISNVAVNAFAQGLPGASGPEPVPPLINGGSSKNFDPFGFTEKAPEWLLWFRESELKHGRIAMLATVGFVVPEFLRVPGSQFSFEAIPRILDAHDKLPESMIQIFGWISFLEAVSFPALANMNNYDRKPGNFGFDPLGFFPTDPEKQKYYEEAEIKNGRLAMIAIGGMVHGAIVTGHGFPYLP